MRRRHHGMTVAEVLIAGGLTLLLGMILLQVLFPSFRIVQEGYIRTELQQQGELTLQQVQSDLQRTVPTGVSLAIPSSSSEWMIMATQPLQDVLNNGYLEFQSKLFVIYHDVTRKQVFREYFPPNPPAITVTLPTLQAVQLMRPNLELIAQQANGTERSLAQNVEYFLVEKEYTTGGEVYACRIQLKKEIPGKNRFEVVELTRKVMLRNHQ